MKKRIYLTMIAMLLGMSLVGCGGGGGTTGGGDDGSGDGDGGGDGDASGYTAYPYDTPPLDTATRDHFLKAVNDARSVEQDCGEYGIMAAAPALEWSDELYSASYEHSVDLSIVGESSPDISHTGSGGESDWTAQVQELEEGSSPWDRGKNNGFDIDGKYTSGENIHSSPTNIEDAMEDWIESDGHCAGLMDPNAKWVAVAVVENQDSQWIYYWTQMFGSEY